MICLKKKRSLFLLLIIALGISTTAFAASEISVKVDGVPVVWTDAVPYANNDGRTMVPLRATADAMGIDVEWNSDTNRAEFTAHYDDFDECPETYRSGNHYAESVVVAFTPGSNMVDIEASSIGYTSAVEMDTTAVVADGRIYAPIRFLAEALGYEVSWDSTTSSVVLVEKYGKDNGGNFVCADILDYNATYVLDKDGTPTFTTENNSPEEIASFFEAMYKDNMAAANIKLLNYYENQDRMRALIDEGFDSFQSDFIEQSVYTTFSLGGYYDNSGYLLKFTFNEIENGYEREAQSYSVASELLSTWYKSGSLNREMSEYARAKVIFDKLLEISTTSKIDIYSYSAWSIFSRGSGVCQAYTGAYNMLLKMDGIDCWGQHGYGYKFSPDNAHIWTVAVLDGVTYHIDATWGAKYFALTDAQMEKDHYWTH